MLVGADVGWAGGVRGSVDVVVGVRVHEEARVAGLEVRPIDDVGFVDWAGGAADWRGYALDAASPYATSATDGTAPGFDAAALDAALVP